MTDLVEKLRVLADPNRASHLGDLWNGLDEAADEIERLRDELTAEREKSARIERETIERCAEMARTRHMLWPNAATGPAIKPNGAYTVTDVGACADIAANIRALGEKK